MIAGMRTTLNLDREIVDIARNLATQKGISLGAAVSLLARRGVAAEIPESRERAGNDSRFPVFSVSEAAPEFTSDDVRNALEEE